VAVPGPALRCRRVGPRVGGFAAGRSGPRRGLRQRQLPVGPDRRQVRAVGVHLSVGILRLVRDGEVVADYVASIADHYEDEVACSWADVVATVRTAVQAIIERDGAFVTSGDVGGFVCQ
jgi:hypothetical protein